MFYNNFINTCSEVGIWILVTKRLLGGKYFISMGTAMIFESSEFDIRKWPNLMYLNLRTLYRNYVASIPTDYQKHVKVKDMLEDFFKEVSTVETIIKEVSQNRVKILFYYPRYEHLDKVLPEVQYLTITQVYLINLNSICGHLQNVIRC